MSLTLDEIKARLCVGKFSSLTIRWNDSSASNYETVADTLGQWDDYYSDDTFTSMDEKQKCIDENSIWTAQWYPDTPNGFCTLHASTFSALLEALEKETRCL